MNLLLVEDDPSISTPLLEGLAREGFAVQHAATGAAAIAAVAGGSFDVLLLDLGLPDMGGQDVCRIVREKSDVPIIVVSARGEEIDRVLLLEFPHDRVPVGAEEFVLWLLARKIRPMIAHPERNRDVLRDLARIEPFVRMGCLLQVTADAVSGGFGSRCEARAAELLERGWVAVLASDGHDTGSRPPRMSAGRDAAARLVGAAAARRLTVETPQRILDGR